MKPYFQIENLKVNFKTFEGEKNVLDIEELVMEKGKAFGLVGESGTGKSVLAQTILGLLSTPPGVIKHGKINFNGEDLLLKRESEMQKIRGKKISMIFQDPMSSLNPVFTVGSQLIRVIRHNRNVSKKEAYKIAIENINQVKIPDPEDIMLCYPHELSGGQRQRIIIAMALSCKSEFLIADEPTRNLDVTIQAGILKLISQLQKEFQVSVLFIANNLGLVSATCDYIGILHKGKIIETGSTKKTLKTPVHPYTKALIQAMSKNKQEPVKESDAKTKSDTGDTSNGCRSMAICLNKDEVCSRVIPTLTQVGESHSVACHHPVKHDDNQVNPGEKPL